MSESDTWAAAYTPMLCERCDARFLSFQEAAAAPLCPACYQASLVPLDSVQPTAAPELAIPYRVDRAQAEAAIQRFTQGIPYPPEDLNAAGLVKRLSRQYLPVWLVDAEVCATWKVEAGYNYEVVSHQDRYQDGGGWASREVKEQRIRWEPRLGKLQRTYTNITAPALENDRYLKTPAGNYRTAEAQIYQPQAVAGAFVRLPDRSPQDAWSEARPALQSAAAEECRQAAGADHQRGFAWQADFANHHWTMLLLPALSTCYRDDEGKLHAVWINGQTGQITGSRRASMKRAQAAAVKLLVAAVMVFLLSLLLGAASIPLPVLLPVAIIAFALAVIAGLAAIVPIARVWKFNQ